ncbi:hypothetical protein chiPu_0005240, partial [Chiloscyllium punctatum]|nr:hypothetical protein [Chiloscyllium punctatum]
MANYTHTTNIMDLAGLQDLRKHSVIEPRITIKELTINFSDIIEGKDEWSVQDKISQKVLRKLLDHIVLRSFIIALLIGSCIAISCQTDPAILEEAQVERMYNSMTLHQSVQIGHRVIGVYSMETDPSVQPVHANQISQ